MVWFSLEQFLVSVNTVLVKVCNSHRHDSANYTNIIIDFSSSAEQVSNPPFEVSECDIAKLLIGQENLSRDHIYKIKKKSLTRTHHH